MAGTSTRGRPFLRPWPPGTLSLPRRLFVAVLVTVLVGSVATVAATGAGRSTTSTALARPRLAKGMVEELRPFSTGSVTTTNWSGINQDFAQMAAAGVTWVRIYIACGNPTSYWDRVIALLRRHGLQLLANINCNVGVASSVVGPYTPTQYIRWLGAFVRRYRGSYTYQGKKVVADVHYYEIGNEENSPQEFDTQWYCLPSDPTACTNAVSDYIYRMHDAYTTVHDNDPRGYVIWGGISSYQARSYVQAMLTASVVIKGRTYHAWDFMDALGYHPYSALSATTGDVVTSSLATLRMVERLKGRVPAFARKPVWITEVGLWCAGDALSFAQVCPEQTRATELTSLLTAIKANGIHTPVFWYIFHEPATNLPGFGLVELTPTGRVELPAYQAFREYDGYSS